MTARAFTAFIMRRALAKQRGAALRVKLWLNLRQKVAPHVGCALLRAANIRHVQNGQHTRVSTARRLSEFLVRVLPGGKLRLRPVSIYSSTGRQKYRYEG